MALQFSFSIMLIIYYMLVLLPLPYGGFWRRSFFTFLLKKNVDEPTGIHQPISSTCKLWHYHWTTNFCLSILCLYLETIGWKNNSANVFETTASFTMRPSFAEIAQNDLLLVVSRALTYVFPCVTIPFWCGDPLQTIWKSTRYCKACNQTISQHMKNKRRSSN